MAGIAIVKFFVEYGLYAPATGGNDIRTGADDAYHMLLIEMNVQQVIDVW